ncbi:MAG: phosphoserine phosphatase SerB [Bryobacteraceae bacterium]
MNSGALLIHVTGQDRPGVTHALMRVLARHGARVLDIGQAVIHDALALGILVELTAALRASTMMTDLLLEAHRLGVQIRYTEASAERYAQWVAEQRKRRYIVTALGCRLDAEAMAAVAGEIARAGLNIDRIDRLSARMPLEAANGSPAVCVEFTASAAAPGSEPDEGGLRTELARVASETGIDIAFQHDSIWRRHRRLIAFDMDSTLIQGEVIDELAAEAGAGEAVRRITEAAMRGELDFGQAFRQRVALLRGLREEALQRVVERIPLTEGAERLTRTLKRLGYRMAILSGGFTFFGRVLQERLGIDYLHANTLVVRDGVVTGEVAPPVVDGQEKARRLRALAAEQGLDLEQCIAVGDGANDLPMLRLAGLGIAFRAKPVVRAGARQSLSTVGLDGILYLLGLRDRETALEPEDGRQPSG